MSLSRNGLYCGLLLAEYLTERHEEARGSRGRGVSDEALSTIRYVRLVAQRLESVLARLELDEIGGSYDLQFD